MVEQLRVRLDASLAKLHSGQVTGTGTEEVRIHCVQLSGHTHLVVCLAKLASLISVKQPVRHNPASNCTFIY